MRTTLVASLLVAASALSFAQTEKTHPYPHVFEAKGLRTSFAVLLGGQSEAKTETQSDGTTKTSFTYQKIEWTLFPNTNHEFFPILRDTAFGFSIGEPGVQRTIDGSVLTAREKGSGMATGRRMHLMGNTFDSITIPALGRDIPTPGPFTLTSTIENRVVERVGGGITGGASVGKPILVWRQPSFSLSIEGLPPASVHQTSPMRLRVIGPDMEPDLLTLEMDPFSFTIPSWEAGPFLEALKLHVHGDPHVDKRLMSFTVNDGSSRLLTVESYVQVVSVDDYFLFDMDGQPSLTKITVKPIEKREKELRGHVTLIK